MVLMGHSQGGLLAKMTVVDSDSVFWNNAFDTPFEQTNMSDQTRALLKEAMFVKPLPFVTRVIFVSTPHHGSYLAGPEIVRRLAARLVSMPRDLVSLGAQPFTDSSQRVLKMQRVPTSLDNMSPTQPFIKSLSSLPIAPGVAAHSIIPVLGDGPLEDEVDGVVAYKSAHIEGVESEVVIHHSGHSTQSDPRTVDEVRRILLLHVETADCGQPPLRVTAPLQPASTKPGAGSGALRPRITRILRHPWSRVFDQEELWAGERWSDGPWRSRRRRSTAPRPPAGAPNVVLIVLDDLGFAQLGCFGSDIETPAIDARRRGRPALQPLPRHRALLADPRLPAHRPQPPRRRHGLPHRHPDRPARLQRAHPAQRRDAAAPAARRRLQHLRGRQVAPDAALGADRPRARSTAGRSASASSATTASSTATPTSGRPSWCATTASSSRRAGRKRATT